MDRATEQADAREECCKHAMLTGEWLGLDYVGGGGIPVRYEDGCIIVDKAYLLMARLRREARMKGEWI